MYVCIYRLNCFMYANILNHFHAKKIHRVVETRSDCFSPNCLRCRRSYYVILFHIHSHILNLIHIHIFVRIFSVVRGVFAERWTHTFAHRTNMVHLLRFFVGCSIHKIKRKSTIGTRALPPSVYQFSVASIWSWYFIAMQ